MIVKFKHMHLKSCLVYLTSACPSTFPKQQILDPPKVKEFAYNLYFGGNVRKFSTWGRKQCLPFPQCFQKTCTADT